MNLNINDATRILFPEICRNEIIHHCRRKLNGEYIDGENQNLKAYGLVAGDIDNDAIKIKHCFPLLKNARADGPYKKIMDELMTKHAIPSETPFEKRGWVADPDELMEKVRLCKDNKTSLVGTYHMHRVGWKDDALRDTPTGVDTVLATDSRLIMFIVSMVDPCRPIIRAFYEGKKDLEIPVIFVDN